MILDRSKAPEFRIPREINFPKPETRTLSNGVPVFFIPTPEIDAVRIEISSGTDPFSIPFEKLLVPSFTLYMLLEGTNSKSANELDDIFDTFASEVDPHIGFEYLGLSLLTTKKHFSNVLPIFRELLSEATFPEKELAKRKKQKALSISIQKEQNGHRASQLFRKLLFGENHPFGQIAEESDVNKFEKKDLIGFYENNLWTNPELFLTGNIDSKEFEHITGFFETLPVHRQIQTSQTFVNGSNFRVLEEKEKSVQSSIRIGCHMIPKTHPDYIPLLVFNTILGGYFGSRLIKNIREEKGHTYGISSSLGGLKSSDYWVVMADVIKENANEVIEEIYKEILLLQTVPISQNELYTVRNYMVGKLLTQFSSGFDLISRFKSIHQSGLDFGFFQNQLDYILNFSPEDMISVGNKYFHRENMVEVIVG